MNNSALNNCVILLTGAAGYLGSAIAKGLVESGAEIILAGRTSDSLESLANELETLGGKAQPLVLDVGNESSRVEAVGWIEKRYGRLDGIINNAYNGRAGSLDKIDSNDFTMACSQNISGPFHLIQLALPMLEKTAENADGGVSIVNIASMYGKVSPDPSIYGDSGQNNPIHYGATKAGMIQMTRYLACHLAGRNIRVNSISPGPFPRPGIKDSAPDFMMQLEKKVPMGRIGNASELVGPVLFLLSPSASYITGIDLPVDGGWTAW